MSDFYLEEGAGITVQYHDRAWECPRCHRWKRVTAATTGRSVCCGVVVAIKTHIVPYTIHATEIAALQVVSASTQRKKQ